MKFGHIVEELLNELGGDEIHQKYYPEIPPNTFWAIASADPQTIRTNSVKKIGRYTKILLSMYKDGHLKLEDLPRATEYLTLAYKHKVPLDINKIHNLTDMFNVVKKYIAVDTNDFGKVLSMLPKNEYKLIHNGKEWMIFIPKTEKAACTIGVGTEWCTTWGKNSLNKSKWSHENHYARYDNQGPLYILVNKQNTEVKYQFHFESKQFMNRHDADVDGKDILNENPELKKFFFPSLYNEVPKEEMKKELSMIDILSNQDSLTLISKFVGTEHDGNALATAIIGNNEMLLQRLIVDDNLFRYYHLTVEQGKLNFMVVKSPYTVSEVKSTIASFETEKNYALDNLHENMLEGENNWPELLEPIFSSYYKDNDWSLRNIGIDNYETFKHGYFENFYNDDEIKSEFIHAWAILTAPNYEAHIETEINKIEKYISFDSTGHGDIIMIPAVHFIEYILTKNIHKINNNLDDILDDYCEYFHLPTEFYYDADYDYVYPTYENLKMRHEIDAYFDKILENPETGKACAGLRQTLNDVIKRIFKGNTRYSNEHVEIYLKNTNINCVDGTIGIRFTNKDTGKTFDGDVKVENLASYATNYKLFEMIFTFKKNIL